MPIRLDDQRGLTAATTLAIALGANLPSVAGEPVDTLVQVRPLLEQLVLAWHPGGQQPGLAQTLPPLHWSPLFATAPVGGPPDQPTYINAVLLVELGLVSGAALAPAQAEELLEQLQRLELRFGRERFEPWAPRSLDLDLLWIACNRLQGQRLELPHPRVLERAFVLAPLAAIDPNLSLAGIDPQNRCTAGLLQGVLAAEPAQAGRRLPARAGWPEA